MNTYYNSARKSANNAGTEWLKAAEAGNTAAMLAATAAAATAEDTISATLVEGEKENHRRGPVKKSGSKVAGLKRGGKKK